jgi:uncharacterized protein HemX
MLINDAGSFHSPYRAKSNKASLLVLFLGMALALAGNVYQFVRGEHLKRDLAVMQTSTQNQIAKLHDAEILMLEENQQRFETIQNQLREATAAKLRHARSVRPVAKFALATRP